MRRHHSRFVSVALAIGVLAAMADTGRAQNRSLNILLTNDDGFDSTGLTVMRTALLAAGHRVTVVAPATNMSSSSMSMTSGTLKVESKGDAIWAVHGTPTDAVMVGLAHILRGTPQDLVVSGTNTGQNLGSSTNGSGTVSAAIAAARFGVPAIATSAGLGPESLAAYATAAAITTQMIAALIASQPAGDRLLPDRLVINMNVPAMPAARLQGLRWAPLSRGSSYTRVYSAADTPNDVRSRLALSTEPVADKDTDLALFGQGYVTLTLLDGDLSVSATVGEAVAARLATLALPRPVPVK